jgi:hypothetical protein
VGGAGDGRAANVIRVQLRDAIEIGREMFGTLEDPRDGQLWLRDPTFVLLTTHEGARIHVPWSNVRCVVEGGPSVQEAAESFDPLVRKMKHEAAPAGLASRTDLSLALGQAMADPRTFGKKKGKHSKP